MEKELKAGRVIIVAAGLAFTLKSGGGRQGDPAGVVDDLGIDVLARPEHRQARTPSGIRPKLETDAPLAAQDARDRRFIRQGMHEGEVLLRVGKPDHEAFIRNVRGQPEEKTWAYFPHPRDPQTLTIYTLRAGVVSSIERKIVR